MWTQIDQAPAQILDVDATRILYKLSSTQVAILDRTDGTTTTIPGPAVPYQDEHVVKAYLSSHGAVVVTRSGIESKVDYKSGRIHEWRDGALVLVADPIADRSAKVVGDVLVWVTWEDPHHVFMRDLDTGTNIDLGEGVGDNQGIAPNGDVVWRNEGIWRRRASDGVIEKIGDSGEDPLTDGINTIWWTSSPADIHGVGPPPTNAPLADFTGVPHVNGLGQHINYDVDGGWIAYSRADPADGAAHSIWRRAPGTPTDVQVTPDGEPDSYMMGLNEEGELLYRNYPALGEWFAAPGEDPVHVSVGAEPLLSHEGRRGMGDHVFSVGGRWYYARGNTVGRLQEDAAPVPGARTTIDDGPPGVVDDHSDPTFEFSSTDPDDDFECRLDGGDWEACSSPKTYPSPADGLHTFMVRAVESDGDVEPEPASQAWVVDTEAPVTTLVLPAHDGATSDTTPVLQGQGGTSYGDGDVTVEVWAGSTAGGAPPIRTFEARPHPNGTWHVPAVEPALPEGVYTARARQTDVAGHDGLSSANTFTVDTTAPAAFEHLSPPQGATVGPNPAFTWEASTDTGSGIDRYDLLVILPPSTGWEIPTTSCSGGVCSASLPNALADGEYVWLVRVFDRAGNMTVTAQSRDLVVDATPAAPFSLASPADGARTTDTTPTLDWDPTTDATAGMGTYDVFVDGSRVASGLEATEHTLAGALADGPHTWRVEAVDSVGNVRSSATQTIVVDTTPPAAALSARPNPVLAGDDVLLDASASTDAHGGALVRHEWDLDGDGVFDRDTGRAATTTTSFSPAGLRSARVRVTDEVGHTAEAGVDVSARLVPPPGFPGVTINDGERFTNDPDVTLDVVWLPLTTGLLVANDGGFRDAGILPVAAEIPWRLESTGPERLPRTVYLRFAGVDGARETYQDDIILDETPPLIRRAEMRATSRPRTFRLRVAALDNVSGLEWMQVSSNRRRPGRARPFRPRLTVLTRRARLSVRVRDRAGNWSRWKLASRG